MDKLLAGLKKFRREIYPRHQELFESLAEGQSPEVLFVGCADSRIDPMMLTQSQPGDLFVLRNAGNIIPPHGVQPGGMTASVEFGVAALKVKHIIVCGHKDCGAMKAAMRRETVADLPHVDRWLTHAEAAVEIVAHSDIPEHEKLEAVTRENILLQIQHLRTHPMVAAREKAGLLSLHGWLYDFSRGLVDIYNDEKKSWIAFDSEPDLELAG